MAESYQATFQRIEIKYLLTEAQAYALRAGLETIAAVDAYGRTSILNLYYDTPDDLLIRRSLEKPVYKEKLRLRTYGVPCDHTPAYVEIKKKYDGIVYKRRTGMSYNTAKAWLDGCDEERGNAVIRTSGNAQILGEINYFRHFYPSLRPRMAISYDRTALAGIQDPALRITFDEHIRYRTTRLDLREGDSGRELLEPGQQLMEIKVAGAIPTELAHLFSTLRIVPCSYSKYGRGYVDMVERMGRARTVHPGRAA